MEGVQIDGNNILAVYDTIKGVRQYCIEKQKPYLIECITFRMRGHEEASGTKYVPAHLFETWEKKDPVKNYEQFLLKEGVLREADITQLREQTKQHIEHELEIGFNAGHSADTMLRANKNLSLVSFDLGCHGYVQPAADYIQFLHPGRHELILGDSTQTLPLYIEANPDKKFDLLFIDGGHDYEVAKADMENCLKLAHSDSIIVMDDTIYVAAWEKDYSKGPTKVWKEFCAAGTIKDDVRITLDSYNGISYGQPAAKSEN
jgi:predicted O-methyltransferase YrrM